MSHTVKELKSMAKKAGITGFSTMNKEELCKVLKIKCLKTKTLPKKASPKKKTTKKASPKKASPKKVEKVTSLKSIAAFRLITDMSREEKAEILELLTPKYRISLVLFDAQHFLEEGEPFAVLKTFEGFSRKEIIRYLINNQDISGWLSNEDEGQYTDEVVEGLMDGFIQIGTARLLLIELVPEVESVMKNMFGNTFLKDDVVELFEETFTIKK